ncbi:MAG: alpha/beta hydrolase [Synergistaceae bacterium]|nr:alpha/beta hydrolase [Synergistaceae bacterium]
MFERAESGKYVEIHPGIELYYEEVGEGTPLLLVPGWTFTTEVFAYQLEYFSKKYRVIALDPRSQGRSPVQQTGNNYERHAADLARFIKALGLRDIVLLGWSVGNHTVWKYVEQEGTAALKALVTIDMSPTSMSPNPENWTEGTFEELGGAYNMLETTKGHRDFVEAYAREIMVQRKLSPAEMFWIIEQSTKTPTHIARELFASLLFSDCTKGAKTASESVPTLNFIAEHWSAKAEPFMTKLFPKTKNVIMGGHLLFWEHHEKFNKILEEFIDSL